MSKSDLQENFRKWLDQAFDEVKKKPTSIEEAFEKAFKQEDENLNPPEFTPYIDLTPKDEDDEII